MILDSYIFLTNLLKIILYNYFKVEISFILIKNQKNTS